MRPETTGARRALLSSAAAAATTIALLFALATPDAASAADREYRLWSHVSGTVGSFFQTTETKLRVAGQLEEGDEVDFEGETGLDDSETLFRASVRFQPFKRSEFGVGYYDLSRSATRVLEEDIVFDDIVFPAGSSATAAFDIETFQINYTYWAIRKERHGFGPVFGVILMRLDASLAATDGEQRVSGSAKSDLPVPMLGVGYKVAILPQLNFSATGILLPSVTFGDVEGSASDVGVRLDYFPIKNLGIGVSWSRFNIDVDVDSSNFVGNLDYRISGTQLYLAFQF